MAKILHIRSVNDYARYISAPVLHELVSVIHYDELTAMRHSLNSYEVYAMFLNDGEQMEQELSGTIEVMSAERGAASSLLSFLSNEFTTADLIKLRARKGQSVSGESIRKLLQRWRNNGRIEKVSENTWTRLAE